MRLPHWRFVHSTIATLSIVFALLPASGAGAASFSWSPGRPSGPNCGATVYKANGTPWTCTFADEFSGNSLDTTKWSPITTASTGLTDGGDCYVNSPNNVSVSGGYLHLTVRQEAQPFTCNSPYGSFTTQYTGGSVTTSNKFSQTYGLFAVRAAFPASVTAGLQSSLWLYPQKPSYGAWPASGEIDIAEQYSLYPDRAIPYVHYTYDQSQVDSLSNLNVVTNNYCMIDDVTAFHTYQVEWDPGTITISYDGQTCLVDDYQSAQGGTAPFNQPFFMTLTQALGIGTNAVQPGVTPLPATTTVDWVHIWK